jgi:hypothetical protein
MTPQRKALAELVLDEKNSPTLLLGAVISMLQADKKTKFLGDAIDAFIKGFLSQ